MVPLRWARSWEHLPRRVGGRIWLDAHSVTCHSQYYGAKSRRAALHWPRWSSVITESFPYGRGCSWSADLARYSPPHPTVLPTSDLKGWWTPSCEYLLFFWINLGRSDPVFREVWRVFPLISVALGMVPYCINSDLCYFTLHFLPYPWVKIINSCWFTALELLRFLHNFLFFFFWRGGEWNLDFLSRPHSDFFIKIPWEQEFPYYFLWLKNNAPKGTEKKVFNFPAFLLVSLIASLCSALSPVLVDIIKLYLETPHFCCA